MLHSVPLVRLGLLELHVPNQPNLSHTFQDHGHCDPIVWKLERHRDRSAWKRNRYKSILCGTLGCLPWQSTKGVRPWFEEE